MRRGAVGRLLRDILVRKVDLLGGDLVGHRADAVVLLQADQGAGGSGRLAGVGRRSGDALHGRGAEGEGGNERHVARGAMGTHGNLARKDSFIEADATTHSLYSCS
ncbi:MAG: hypothetical protein AB202_01375 [Parcubacteria bacterium C7867-007]|nr:MAG: hypothetical protein AB202_01375 [Parcubacteria bacterium C7867-007]